MLFLSWLACVPNSTDTEHLDSGSQTFPETPYTELLDQGVDRYFGTDQPADVAEDAWGVRSHRFAVEADGPRCLYGTEFNTMTRDQGSDDLIIFLQGGGLCYSDLCIAVSSGGPGMPDIDILDTVASFNPVADWNQVYVPYCDGSLFGGDVDIDDDGDGVVDRYHRGLRNISAALGVAVASFPAPSRILLAGSSGGGYGTLIVTVLVRMTWPEAELFVFNDAGVGLGVAGDPDFIWDIIEEFHAESIIPASQASLLDGGHLTPMVGWQLSEDPKLSVSAFSHLWDYVISQMYLSVSVDDFEFWLREETDALQKSHPGRYQSFLAEGSMHTTLLGDPSGFVDADSSYYTLIAAMLGGMDTTSVSGVTIADWLDAFVSQDPEWTALSD